MTGHTRKLYPEKWEKLALACKQRAGFKCEHCGTGQFAVRTSKRGTPYYIYLHAAHKYHDKDNPEPELLCLCISCHSKLDYQHKQREARVRLECLKHLKLLVEQGAITIREY